MQTRVWLATMQTFVVEVIPGHVDLSGPPLTHCDVKGSVGDFSHPERVVDVSLVLGDGLHKGRYQICKL